MPNEHPAMCLFLTVCFLMCHHLCSVTTMRILKYSSKLLLIFFYFYGNYLSIENVLIGEKGKGNWRLESFFLVQELSTLHDRHLNRPTLDDSVDEEQTIEITTKEITQVCTSTLCQWVLFLDRCNLGRGEVFLRCTPYNALYDEAPPQRAGISLVEVFKRAGTFIILIC